MFALFMTCPIIEGSFHLYLLDYSRSENPTGISSQQVAIQG